MDHPAHWDDAAHAAFASFDIDGQPGKALDPSTRAHVGHPEANGRTPPLPRNTNAVANTAHPKAATSRRIGPWDDVEQRDKVFYDIVNWDYFRGHFRRIDQGTCLQLLRQLCEDMPRELLPEIQKMFSVTASPATPVIDKSCPKCGIPFSGVTERYYHCGKENNPYNIYECRQCMDQNRVGEYSDMRRLGPPCRQFKNLNNDIKLVEWTRREKDGKSYWWLPARGQQWTRCDEPTCHALYKYFSGNAGQHSVEKHWKNIIGKSIKQSRTSLN